MNQTLSYFSSFIYKDFLAYTAGQLQAMGLSHGSMPFILYLGKHPGCTPSQLTGALHMDWGHSQRSLNRLEENGFLTREKAGRTHILELTDRGRQAFSLCHQVFTDWDQEHLSVLSEEEQHQLLSLMGKLVAECEAKHHV